jgi:hypothetical protein
VCDVVVLLLNDGGWCVSPAVQGSEVVDSTRPLSRSLGRELRLDDETGSRGAGGSDRGGCGEDSSMLATSNVRCVSAPAAAGAAAEDERVD